MEVKDAFDTEGKKLFIGTEYEGPNTGLRTLFVQGNVPDEKIVDALNNHPDVKMLYFGAGRLSEFWLGSIVGFAIESEPGGSREGMLITIESPFLQQDLVTECKNVFHMLTLTMPSREIADETVWSVLTYYQEHLTEEQKAHVIVKIDTGKYVMCVPLDKFAVNDYSGYANDVLLWEE